MADGGVFLLCKVADEVELLFHLLHMDSGRRGRRSPSPPNLLREGPSPYPEREGRYPERRGDAASTSHAVDEATLLRQQQQALAWQQQQQQSLPQMQPWGGPSDQMPWQQWGLNY